MHFWVFLTPQEGVNRLKAPIVAAFPKRCPFISIGNGGVGVLYTALLHHHKDTACRTFPVLQGHCPHVKALGSHWAAMRQSSRTIFGTKTPENYLCESSLKPPTHDRIFTDRASDLSEGRVPGTCLAYKRHTIVILQTRM